LSVAKTGLPVVEIIVIVICSVAVLIVVIVGLCWYCNCRNSRHTQRGNLSDYLLNKVFL
jgi:uncharacterized membrane protein affecting hemolysin expression